MKIAIGSDHAGYDLKQYLLNELVQQGYELKDYGTHSTESCDYPDMAVPVCRVVSEGEYDFGILICGTGVGMSLAANRFPKIRAANVAEPVTAQLTREHNDANVLCLGSRVIGPLLAVEIARTFLATPFSNETRHKRRIEKIEALSHCTDSATNS